MYECGPIQVNFESSHVSMIVLNLSLSAAGRFLYLAGPFRHLSLDDT